MNVTVYHNPQCSKSRGVLEILDEKNIAYEIVRYTENPPDAKTLRTLLQKLGLQPSDIIRKNEAAYLPHKNTVMSEDEVLDLLLQEPILIERPIVVCDDKAVVARPSERVLEIV